jgi:hypothetical protein
MKRIIAIASIVLTSCTVTKQSSRICIVVDDVVYKKNNTASIKPRTNRQGPKWWTEVPWFRYPNHNVHIGDTVDISLKDRIEPKF